MSGLKIDYQDNEQLFLLDEVRIVMEQLENVSNAINYLKRPISYTGILHKNQSGRYELENGYYYTSGSSIEFLCTDRYHETYNEKSEEYEIVPYWCKSSVEHDGNDYYIVGHNDILMENLQVRVRSRKE